EPDQRPERDVLGQREHDRETPLVGGRSPANGVEGEPEDDAVQRVEDESELAVPAAEDLHVRVRAREDALVERFQESPDGRRGGTGGSRSKSRAHGASMTKGDIAAAMPEGDAAHRVARRVLVLARAVARRLGPDIRALLPDVDAMRRGPRAETPARAVGAALLDWRLIGGVGHVWKVESLWAVRVSPWLALADVSDDALRLV